MENVGCFAIRYWVYNRRSSQFNYRLTSDVIGGNVVNNEILYTSMSKNTFSGTIDELLNHVDTNSESIINIKNEPTQREILDSIQETLDGMITDGLIQVYGANDNGEPLYKLTKKGESYVPEDDV